VSNDEQPQLKLHLGDDICHHYPFIALREEVYEVVNKGKQYCVQAHWLTEGDNQLV